MTGGILQIVAYGIEDLFLIGDPQITFFKTVYRRHTNFTRNEQDLTFDNTLDFGRKAKCKIKKNGDLLHRLFLIIQLPKIDVKFRSLTIGEVKQILLQNDIIWQTDRNDSEIFDQNAFDEVTILVNDKIDQLNEEINIINQIIPLLNNELSTQNFFNLFPNEDQSSVIEYFDFLILKLIEFDDLELQYKYTTAHDIDRTDNNLDLVNAVVLQELLFEEFSDFATGKTTFDPDSFNDENLLFIFNTDTANYNISGSLNQLTSDTVFRAGIANTYGDENFFVYDAYKIFDSTLNNQAAEINSNFDIQIIKQILLDNERFGLIKNPKMLVNVLDSLDDDFKFIFYKKLTRRAPGIYEASDDFVNLSQIVSQAEEFNDNWTFDFLLLDEPGEPASVVHPYTTTVNSNTSQFHTNNRLLFRTSRLIDYFNNFTLWSRINIGAPGDPDLDNFSELCKTEIEALFEGEIPENLVNMQYMGYIPLLTANDIPIAIDRYLNGRILIGDNPDIVTFKPTLISLLEAERNAILAILLPLVCDDDNILTQNRLSDFRRRIGEDGDIIIHAIIKHNIFLELNGVKLSFPEYVIQRFLTVANNFSAIGYDMEKENVIKAINLFRTPINEFPSHITYINLDNNLRTDIRINNENDPILSDAISSIWYNLLTGVIQNFNDLYDQTLLGRNFFEQNLGSEMKSYLDFILETYFNSPTPIPPNVPNPINFWFDTLQANLPKNLGPIGTFLFNKISIFDQQLSKFDLNRPLLNMRSLIIPKEDYYFEKFENVLGFIIDENIEFIRITVIDPDTGDPIEVLLYDHENHGLVGLDPVINAKNEFLDPTSGKPQNNAIDIFEFIDDDFLNNFLPTTTNPYTIPNDPNKFVLWNEYDLREFNRLDERDKWRNLFNFISPQELFKIVNEIDVNYNGFAEEKDFYRFMKDIIVQNSTLSDLFNLKGLTVDETFENILDYYETQLALKEEQLINITGSDNTSSLLEQLENTLSGGLPANFAWIHKIGHYLIDCIEITIGGQLIDKHYGEWLNIWYELTKKTTKERGYNILIGDVPRLTEFNTEIKEEYELIIPLRFWFCRHIGMSLPIIALQHSNIEINVKLKTFEEVSFVDNFIDFGSTPKLKCKMLAEYIYVESDERKKLATTKLEYLIDTLQFSGDFIITKDTPTVINEEQLISAKVYFQNPVKELIFGCQDRSFINGSRQNNERKYHFYGTDFETGNNNPFEKAKIEFMTRDRESFKEANYYNFVHPYEKHKATPPVGIHNYAFSLNPELFQPSGAANMSKIDDAAIVFKLKDDIISRLENENLRLRFFIYATSYNVLRILSGLSGLVFYQ